MSPGSMIAIDWGTSSFRAYLVDEDGRVREKRAGPDGILAVTDGRFASVLDRYVSDWTIAGAGPIIMCGMIGARQGWVEVPYVPCPAGVTELAAALGRVEWGDGHHAWIVPGVSCRDAAGVPDVMRGEEVQVLGALQAIDPAPEWFCLPGTHSKWVHVADERLTGFSTHMTGECFAVLKAHSLLGRMMTDDTTDMEAFDAGVRRAGDPGGLLHHLFGTRALGLFGELRGPAAASYLSGLLIGHELLAIPIGRGPVPVIGSGALTALYGRAMPIRGLEGRQVPEDIVVGGLLRLAALVRTRS